MMHIYYIQKMKLCVYEYLKTYLNVLKVQKMVIEIIYNNFSFVILYLLDYIRISIYIYYSRSPCKEIKFSLNLSG